MAAIASLWKTFPPQAATDINFRNGYFEIAAQGGKEGDADDKWTKIMQKKSFNPILTNGSTFQSTWQDVYFSVYE